MRHFFARFIWAGSLLSVACATAIEDLPPALDEEMPGKTLGGSTGAGGTSSVATGGKGATTGGGTSSVGKGGSGSSSLGGTSTTGGSSKGGSSHGGSPSSVGGSGGQNVAGAGGSGGGSETGGNGGSGGGGASSGGKAGMSNGGTTSGGTTSGGTTSGGTTSGGSATGGSPSGGSPGGALCDGIPNWTSKDYALGDIVASTCGGVFQGTCPEGQKHEFECRPPGPNPELALAWCKTRAPGVDNGWAEAWVDRGQCQ